MPLNQQAGKLRVLYDIQQHDGAVTDRGQRDDDAAHWSVIGQIWGDQQTLSGTEIEAAHKLFAEATHRVRTRYVSGLTPQHRLRRRADDRLLGIGHVDDPHQRGRELVLLCREEVH